MKLRHSLLVASGFAALCLASEWDRMPVREHETIHNTYSLAGAPFRVSVENVNGYVHVIGTESGNVELTAEKTIRADSDSDLAEARHNVNLEVESKPGSFSAFYKTPEHEDHGNHPRRFYSVTYDITLKIPSGARAFVSTVNGDIQLDGTSGDFELRSVNGPVKGSTLSGSGSVRTVNGPLHLAWARNPKSPCHFSTVNGSIDVTMQPNLAADLAFKTMSGEIFSDFDVMPAPAPVSLPRQEDGRFVYRTSGVRSARIAGGGPELKFETLNGNMRLHSAGKK